MRSIIPIRPVLKQVASASEYRSRIRIALHFDVLPKHQDMLTRSEPSNGTAASRESTGASHVPPDPQADAR